MTVENAGGRAPGSAPRMAGSVRTRLILVSAIITAAAVGAIGYYAYLRTQQATASLADQLEASVRQQAESNLDATLSEQVGALNGFFADMRRDIEDAGSSASRLLSQQARLSGGEYWNASTAVQQLPSGSWDNPSRTDPASIFVPERSPLNEGLASQLNTLKHLDFVVPGKLEANPDAVAVYFGGPSGETVYYPNIDLANIVPADFEVTGRPWYVAASPQENPDREPAWSEPYLDAALHGLVVTTSVPVYDSRGQFRGVVAMDVQLGRISEIVSGISIGQTGYAFVIDSHQTLIALPESGYADMGLREDQAPLGAMLDSPEVASSLPEGIAPVLQRMSAGLSGLETVTIGGLERFVAYRPIPEVGYGMAILVPTDELLTGAAVARAELLASSANTTRVSILLVVIILILAAAAAAILSNTLTSPLVALTRTAHDITAGDLNARAEVRSRDEIGVLAETVNSMAASLQGMVLSLEERVRERTAALAEASEEANRRAAQFEAITRVTRAIGSIRNVRELMPLVTSVISETFGYYHVGIFLNDEATQNAYLIAANSEGGRRMLGRHHSLRIGEQGIVGHVAGRGEPRVARNVGEDIVYFNNPDLPATRSEAALPLRVGERTIGVLDVQSTQEDAFQPDDVRILGTLADQVSLAIENTRLLETTQRSLTETETLYRQYVREAWAQFQPEQGVTGFRYTSRGAMPLAASGAESARRAPGDEGVSVPIKLRHETIGDLVVHGASEEALTEDQLELIQAVADRVALSVENARLFDETSRRAARERLVTEITSKIRSVSDPKAMMSTALEELKNVLGASKVQIVPQTAAEESEADGASDVDVPPPPNP